MPELYRVAAGRTCKRRPLHFTQLYPVLSPVIFETYSPHIFLQIFFHVFFGFPFSLWPRSAHRSVCLTMLAWFISQYSIPCKPIFNVGRTICRPKAKQSSKLNDAIVVPFRLQVWCRVVSFFKIYLTSSNYFWMFCEGYYLHRLISYAFDAPSSLVGLCCIGWGKI